MKVNRLDNSMPFKQRYSVKTTYISHDEFDTFIKTLADKGKNDVDIIPLRYKNGELLVTTGKDVKAWRDTEALLYSMKNYKSYNKIFRMIFSDFFKDAIKVTDENINSVLKNN